MSAHPHASPSFQGGDVEKNLGHFDEHHHDTDHDTSDDHSNHDGSSHDDDHDDIEEHLGPLTQPITREKTRNSRASGDLRRTASNVLSAVASRVTTRGWPEPPPPPDGGFKAWLQVACVCLDTFVIEARNKENFPANVEIGMVCQMSSLQSLLNLGRPLIGLLHA